jgi:hypothetical protein
MERLVSGYTSAPDVQDILLDANSFASLSLNLAEPTENLRFRPAICEIRKGQGQERFRGCQQVQHCRIPKVLSGYDELLAQFIQAFIAVRVRDHVG